MNIVIVGCGRVGVELALALHQKHSISMIDRDMRAFDRLGMHFNGRTIQGDGLDRTALERAGIAQAEALAAVTSSDNVNAITARIARDVFHVRRVVARLYSPRRATIYERFNLQIVSSSSWGAQRIEQLLVHPGVQSISSAGNGEVQVYELAIPEEWHGRKISELVPLDYAIPVALERNGRGILPRAEMTLARHDILQVSSLPGGVSILRERVHDCASGETKE